MLTYNTILTQELGLEPRKAILETAGLPISLFLHEISAINIL